MSRPAMPAAPGKGRDGGVLGPGGPVPSQLSMNLRPACPEPKSRAGGKVKQLQIDYGPDYGFVGVGDGAGVAVFVSGVSVDPPGSGVCTLGLRRGVRRGRNPNFSRLSLVGPNLACR